MPAKLTGPRLEAKSGRAKQLIVFLHGYGANGDDLIELGQQWRALLPEAAFVSPHAPERCLGAPTGRQWFALSAAPRPTSPRGPTSAGARRRAAQPVDRRLPRPGAGATRPRRMRALRSSASARGR